MAKLIFSIAPTQIEKESDFSIMVVFSQAQWSSLMIKNLAILTFINKKLQLHEKLKNKDVKDEDIDVMEEYL